MRHRAEQQAEQRPTIGRDARPARISCASSSAQPCAGHRPAVARHARPARRRRARHARGDDEEAPPSAAAPWPMQRITDSACKNQLVVVSVQYGPFNPYIPIRSTTIGKSRVAKDPIAMHTSWRSNSDIASVTSIGYPRMSASGESSTTMHRLLHASGSHPIPPPNDPKLDLTTRNVIETLHDRCLTLTRLSTPLGSSGPSLAV
ncbi:hypothetical protein F511_42567 [Dorcoceras hygrometricum]|uniref:Uncharacterized protein n=1 Tax=Dorcoceras hygrometricum TaxID=472368 RepID=A0A2Z7A053_9LAMI|nr:hypothetical protein F511_42567 [Dorcoceras hygrometricum]